jgi:predicted Ser/Thr protein kinase
VYANNCDTVVRGNFLSDGHEKVVYEGKLGVVDVVIKEAKIDNWRTVEHRYQNYLSLHNEYEVLKSLEYDYPNYSMKTYGFCDGTVPFYIMERGEMIAEDEIYKEPLYRMIQRNTNASIGMIITMDVKWNQLVKKGNELYTIDVNMGDVHDRFEEMELLEKIDIDKYYNLYIWQLYCKVGEQVTFSPVGLPPIPPGPITCDNDPSFFKSNNPEDYIPNTELSYELMPNECTRVVIDKHIAQGAEKKVYNGTLDGKDVAIKKIHRKSIATNYRASLNLYTEFIIMQKYYSTYPDVALKPYAFCIDGTVPYYIIDLGNLIPKEDHSKYQTAVKDMLIRFINIGLYFRDFSWKQIVERNGVVQLIDTGGTVIGGQSLKKNKDQLVRNIMYDLFSVKNI